MADAASSPPPTIVRIEAVGAEPVTVRLNGGAAECGVDDTADALLVVGKAQVMSLVAVWLLHLASKPTTTADDAKKMRWVAYATFAVDGYLLLRYLMQ